MEKSPRRQTRLTDSSEVIMRLLKMAKQGKVADEKESNSSKGVSQTIINPQVLRKLLIATQFRDVDTINHVKRVAQLAIGTARSLGWETTKLRVLEAAALLHDIGKISVPDHILFKPGELDPHEAEVMAIYHNIGLNILQGCQTDPVMLEYIQQSHKSFLPTKSIEKGMKKERTLGARILAVADAYESFSSNKPYRREYAHDKIHEILKESNDPKFDDRIIAAVIRWVENEGREYFLEVEESQKNEKLNKALPNKDLAVTAGEISHIFSYLYLLESLYDGYYVLDENMQVAIWNRGAESLLKLPWQKMYRKKWTSRMLRCADSHGLEYQERDYPVMRAISEGETVASTTKIHRPDGSWIELQLQTVPLLDENNKLLGVIEIFKDANGIRRRPQHMKAADSTDDEDILISLADKSDLESQLQKMLEFAKQIDHVEPLSLIVLDIDFFKTINSTFGYEVGDEVLMDIAKLLQNECYSDEVIGRYGGEEFLIICPETNMQQAKRRAERLRVALPKSPIGGLENFQVTASFGVTQVVPDESSENVLTRVNLALQKAKNSGRNKTCSITFEETRQKELDRKLDEDSNRQKMDPFLYETNFVGFSAHDMIVYKLKGFVEDQDAEIIEVDRYSALVTIGTLGVFKRWGKTDERRAVEVEISFKPLSVDEEEEEEESNSQKHQLSIQVKVVPLGKIKCSRTFHARAHKVVRVLKSFFAAT